LSFVICEQRRSPFLCMQEILYSPTQIPFRMFKAVFRQGRSE
jgi:hypothetical protein